MSDNILNVERIKAGLFGAISAETYVGYLDGKFDNSEELKKELNAVSIPGFFSKLKEQVEKYYESN